MCGIAGLVDLRPCRDEADALKRICARMAHRGPDGDGVHVDGPVALAHRRLSIIDLAGGVQPMSNQDGSIWVTFNGEIYNFEELKRELCSHGHRFVTRSDTEVLLHAYERWGQECVERFRGMFAFGIWDARRRTLFLRATASARSRFTTPSSTASLSSLRRFRARGTSRDPPSARAKCT